MRISAQPPDEWLGFFQKDAGDAAGAARWVVNVQFVELRLSCSPETLPRAVEHVDERIRQANEGYRRWLNEAPNRARVLAIASAQPRHGGSGALYVLLKRRREP